MGCFITFEGIDGSGKSTQAKLLAQRLREQGKDVTLTREPGGSPGAEDIRQLLVTGAAGQWSEETEILLFTAARRDHMERTILPALERGSVVICDRFFDSTRAYQGSGEKRRQVEELHAMMIGLTPDRTLVFDLDPQIGLERVGAREGSETRFESKGLAFQQGLRSEFLRIASEEPERCCVIDAGTEPETVAVSVWDAVAPLLDRT